MKEQDTIQIPEGYQQTQVGLIPEDWYVKPVSELFEYLRTKSYSRDNLTLDEKESNVFYIHYGDIHSKYRYGILDFEKEELIPRLKKEFITNDLTFLNEGDLILADASEDYEGIGVSIELKNIRDKKVVAGLHTFALRDYANCTSKGYRGYLLRNKDVVKNVWRIATGISVLGISKGNFSKILLPLPPVPEQQAIGKCLSTWDDAIEKQQALIEQKELRKKGLMQQLLSGRKRLKGFECKWKMLNAGELFKSFTEKGFENEELLSATQDKGIVPRNQLEGRVTMPQGSTKGYKLVEPGDFVISLRSFQGGLEYSYYRGIVSPAYIVLKPKALVNDEFYKQYYKSYEFIGRLASAVVGIRDGKQISYDDFCIVKIPAPSIKEQTAIAEILSTADNEIELEYQRLQQIKDQKKGLMQQLLTGKKRLKIN